MTHPIVVERWAPDLEIYGKRKAPETKPFALALFSDKAIKAASAWPGKKHNLRFLELDNGAFFYQDALPGQSIFRPRALILENNLAFRDAGANRYLVAETLELAEAKEEARKKLEDTQKALMLQGDKLTEDERRSLGGINEALAKLGPGGSASGDGFLTTFENLYESSAQGVIWDLALPVPVDLIHMDKLGQDRAITLRLLRAATLDDQGDEHNLILKLTNGPTQYALVFGRNNSVQWWHYRNMPSEERLFLEEQVKAIEDTARLTTSDRKIIREAQKQIEKVMEAARQDGRGSDDLEKSEKEAIKNLKAQIKDVTSSKRDLTPEDEKRRSELFTKIFYDRANVNLQEDTNSLFDRIFDVTIRFLRKGQVSIQLDKQPAWIWTNGAISKLRGYNQMLPKNSRLIIHSDGGNFGVCVGRPDYARNGLYRTGVFEPGYVIDPTKVRFDFDADFVSTSIDGDTGTFTGIGPFGQKVVARFLEVKPASEKGGIKTPPQYQIEIELFSDPEGNYSPEVHLVTFHILASDTPERAGMVWQNLPTKNPQQVQTVIDVVSQDATDKTPAYIVPIGNRHVTEGGNANGLPPDIVGREVVLRIRAVSDGGVYDLLTPGIVKRVEHKKVSLIDRLQGLLRFKKGYPGEVHLFIVGIEELLNRPIKFAIIGNGKYPNDFIRELLQNAGLREEEYAGVPTGNIGIKRLKQPAAGEVPDIQPQNGVHFWEYIQELVSKHCSGWRLVNRSSGLVLEPDVYRMRPDLAYSTSYKAHNPLHIKKDFEVWEDWAEYFTEATFTGSVDPQTGKRWASTVTRPEALDERFEGRSLYYTGTPLIYTAEVDDSLSSYEDCVLASRRFKVKLMLPPWYMKFDAAYNPTLRAGDIIPVDGIQLLVENVSRGNVKAGKGTTPRMTVTGRFYEDIDLLLE